jgi:hypothetical protein
MGRGPPDLQAVGSSNSCRQLCNMRRPNLERPGGFYLRNLAQSMLPVDLPIAFLFVKRVLRITFPSAG